MTTSGVRTRFAPSPTGFLHVGGFRTALFAWLLAKHFNGKFVLRIEDTDQARTVPGAVKFIVEEFQNLDVDIDEGPTKSDLAKIGEDWDGAPVFEQPYGSCIQSLRKARYGEVAESLVASGHAYRCDCTAEMLEKERNEQMARKEMPGYSGYCRTRNVPADKPHIIRFKMPFKPTVSVDDAVKGHISWDSLSLRDTVLLKTDRLPTYHLAVVCDDHDMEITHVIRADEWVSSIPIHVLLYEALGWEKPIWAHVPNVMGTDGKKLSKRHGAKSVGMFLKEGFLREALLNYVVMVGWSPGDGEEQEIFTRQELIQRFSLDHVNKASAAFDQNKLLWMNGMYIRKLPTEEFITLVTPFMQERGFDAKDPRFSQIAALVQERVKVLTEVPPMVEFLYLKEFNRDLKATFKQGVDAEKAKIILEKSISLFGALEPFNHDGIEGSLRPLAEELGLKVGAMFGVLRVAVMGKGVTPPLFESFAALGKDETLRRIKETLTLL